MWADFAERMFVHKTSAAIIVLLVFLLLMNFFAVMLRKNLKNVGNINGKYYGRCRLYERSKPSKKETSTSSGIEDRLLPRQQSAMFSCKTHEFPQEASMFSRGKQALVDVTVDIAEKEVMLLLGHLDAVNPLC